MTHTISDVDDISAHLHALQTIVVATVASSLATHSEDFATEWLVELRNRFDNVQLGRGPVDVERLDAFTKAMKAHGVEVVSRIARRLSVSLPEEGEQ